MASRGNPFFQEYSTGDSSETSLSKDPSPETKVDHEFLYPVSLEVVNDIRRITRSYAKNLGVWVNILELPRR